MTCVKPFTIPDRWIENADAAVGSDDTFDTFDNGTRCRSRRLHPGDDQPTYTGYNAERDKGMEVLLKADNGIEDRAELLLPVGDPGNSGGSDYRRDIAGCNTLVVPFGYDLTPEPGNMVGPTKQGMDDLIARDPGAYWDDVQQRGRELEEPEPACRRDSAVRPARTTRTASRVVAAPRCAR